MKKLGIDLTTFGRSRRVTVLAVAGLLVAAVFEVRVQVQGNKTLTTEQDFQRAFTELSNWGRWGQDDELGAANLITPAKRKAAAALVREGLAISLAHDIFQEDVPDGNGHLERTVVGARPGGASDKYAFTGTYHGVDLQPSGRRELPSDAAGEGLQRPNARGRPGGGWLSERRHHRAQGRRGHARGVVRRDQAPREGTERVARAGDSGPQGGSEALEKIEHVKVTEGDVILLYTGRWKHRSEVGPWKSSEGSAGWHADVAYFLKERGVSFIGSDAINDVSPTGFPQTMGLPIHLIALVSLGVDIFDNLDFERAIETARRLNRYEFMFSAAPLRIDKGMGSPLNPLAIF